MNIENISISTLTQLLDDYISSEYDYDYADVFDDEIIIHTYDGKRISITVDVNIKEEGE